MASSRSIKRAQIAKLCELCQEDNSIKWRCIECNMCLCEKCKTHHTRVPATAEHQIVPIGIPLKDIQRKIFTDNISCKEHPKEKTILYCRSCKSLICQDCVSSSHKKHNFDSIKSALDEKLDYLRGIQTKIDYNLKCCESKPSEVQNTKSKLNTIFDKSLTKIKQREDELIDDIRKYSQLLQENVEKGRSQVTNTLLSIEKDISKKRNNLESERDDIEAILTSNQGSNIFKADIMTEDIKFDPLPNKAEEFIPGTTSIKQIQEMFGSLQKLSFSITHDPSEMKLEVINTFTTDLPYIDRVTILDQTSAWVSCYKKEILRKINIKDNNMTTSKELSLKVLDMKSTSNEELLFTVFNDSEVKLIKHSGEIISFLSVAPLLPYGIHVINNNDVIVGVKERGKLYTITDPSQRAVAVYGMDGKQKHRFQYDKEGQRLFTVPDTITTNSNQDILVADKLSDFTGRVVALNKDGVLQWIYEGHSEINTTNKFDPEGIVTTSVGHIVVNDYKSHALHMLSEDGELLAYKVLSGMEIEWPYGLGIDTEGRLWLGCGTGGEETGAKLHILKLC